MNHTNKMFIISEMKTADVMPACRQAGFLQRLLDNFILT